MTLEDALQPPTPEEVAMVNRALKRYREKNPANVTVTLPQYRQKQNPEEPTPIVRRVRLKAPPKLTSEQLRSAF